MAVMDVVNLCHLSMFFTTVIPLDGLFCPYASVFNWVHGKSSLQVSTYNADRFDQPEEAAAWLQVWPIN
ncbi:28S ribosomal protein S29, mitochondrial [Desmophyllum pertusum]|uniref:28S ribosomal protein S29, mitochondrial n=1 Tax=Desmophyllum pertusum TaxID=174260 RepID=A0A9W9YHM4_9CNID|nr:28S ribosomal protein S29, mitochondrial [Desmophyllum pertusum]